MTYTPKEWQCDDFITASELNRMERGIQDALQESGSVPSNVITTDNFIILTGTATNVQGNSDKVVQLLTTAQLAEYGITSNDDVEVVSVSQSYGSVKSFFTYGALSPGGGVAYSYTYPRVFIGIPQESGYTDYGLRMNVCNFYSGSERDIDYRVVLLKLPTE